MVLKWYTFTCMQLTCFSFLQFQSPPNRGWDPWILDPTLALVVGAVYRSRRGGSQDLIPSARSPVFTLSHTPGKPPPVLMTGQSFSPHCGTWKVPSRCLVSPREIAGRTFGHGFNEAYQFLTLEFLIIVYKLYTYV